MWKNVVEWGGPQMTIWRMRIAFWVPKATNKHPEYVILIDFPLSTMVTRTHLNVTLYVHCLSFCTAALTETVKYEVTYVFAGPCTCA